MHFIPSDANHLRSLMLSPANLMRGHWACLVTAGFIHRNAQHLLLNMLGVFIFGRIVERRFGFFKTLFIFLGAQVISLFMAGEVYGYVFHVNMHVIGASGGLMGLIGTAMLIDPFCVTYETLVPLPVMAKGWLFIFADLQGFLGGERDGVSHLTHLFGFLSIVMLVFFFSRREKEDMRRGLALNAFFFVLFLALNALVAGRAG